MEDLEDIYNRAIEVLTVNNEFSSRDGEKFLVLFDKLANDCNVSISPLKNEKKNLIHKKRKRSSEDE